MSDDDTELCGWETQEGEPCQNAVSGDDGTCYLPSHGDPDAEDPVGRDSLLPDRRAEILEAAERGLTLEGIARTAGVGVSTLRDWRNNREGFAAELRRARARGEAELVDEASPEFILERSYDYVKKEEVELSGDVGLGDALSEEEKEMLDEAFDEGDG
jgi:transposase-like protein